MTLERRIFEAQGLGSSMNMKQWRLAKGLTQEQAALALGLSYRHFQKLEAGHCPVTDRTILLMELIK
jgi:transcriptional regulator with XRE-family HTH domain